MHEFSLISGLLEIVDSYEPAHRFERVNVLRLSFGRLCCIEPEAMKFVFAIQSQGTKAEGATLAFEILPIVIHCYACDREAAVEHYPSSCPRCGAEQVVLRGGTESLRLVEMEVD